MVIILSENTSGALSDEAQPRKVLNTRPDGTRSRGKPRMRILDCGNRPRGLKMCDYQLWISFKPFEDVEEKKYSSAKFTKCSFGVQYLKVSQPSSTLDFLDSKLV